MADGIQFELETDAIVAAMLDLGDFAQPFVNEASRESAESIEREAETRLQRQLGPNATGNTLAGIDSRPAYDGNGYVVVSENHRMPNLPLWIDEGTRRGKPRSHSEPARPYFWVSVQLEEGAHYRRISEAVQDAIDAKGLGDA
jgi:hypothetical protein